MTMVSSETQDLVRLLGADAAIGSSLCPTTAARRAARRYLVKARKSGCAEEQLIAMSGWLRYLEPAVAADARRLRRRHNPSTPAGRSALYAWLGELIGTTVGFALGVIVGTLLGLVTGAAWAPVGLGVVGSVAGGLVGSRYGAARPEGLSARDAREAQLGATIGSLLSGPFGLLVPVGAYLGAVPNPNEGELPRGRRRRRGAPAYAPAAIECVERETGTRRVVGLAAHTGNLLVHPSLRTAREAELGCLGRKPQSFAVTHVPTGQLVATVQNPCAAIMLAEEIEQFASPGIASPNVLEAQAAIGGPHMWNARFIAEFSQQSDAPTSVHLRTHDRWLEQNPGADGLLLLESDRKNRAAVAAASGWLVGALAGITIGVVSGGVLFGLLGAAMAGVEGIAPGIVLGGIMGVPLGYGIGTIWGAVTQTDEVTEGPSAPLAAGIGAALLGPIGAAVGAYVAA